MADEPASLVELRVLEGPNLYFPRAAIKLTLDIGGLAAVPEETREAVRAADRAAQRPPGEARHRVPAAVRPARGGPAGPGDRDRVGRDPARRTGAADQRPAPDRGGLPVAAPHPCAGDGTAVAEVLDAVPGGEVDTMVGRGGRAGGRGRARRRAHHDHAPGAGGGGDRHQRQDHDVADDRAHRPDRRPAGRLVQHRRHLHRRRAGRGGGLLGPVGRRPGAGAPAGRARGHRDRPRRHPAQGHRPDPQRRLRGHQRVRRPPRPPGHRHPRPARRGQGRGSPHHPEGRLGGPERRRPPGLRDARHDQGAALGVLPRPGITGDPRGAVGRRPGHDGHRRLDLRAPAEPRPRPAGRARRRTR